METTINRVEIQGFLGRDAEVKNFESGRTLVNLNLATNESFKNNKGEWITTTDWHNVSYWITGKDKSTTSFKKGELVTVTGKLHTRKYKDKSGQDRFITEVVAKKIETVKVESKS